MEMLSDGDILIQRYTAGNWPFIRGLVPFIVTGPNFRRWTLPRSLQLFGEHRFIPALEQTLAVLDCESTEIARESIAELLLREGICEALWAVNVRTAVPESERWNISVTQLRSEIPDSTPISEWTIELLSGMSDASYYRNYLSESGIVLEGLKPPAEDV